jgi:myo-inositol 2-dehydrogenase / D-chiro-inositol 1-dehydrogenase
MSLRIGLIGAGRIGRKHAETLAYRTRGAELAVVADADGDVARAAAAEAGETRWTGDCREVLNDRTIGAVVIAAPTNLHAALIGEAAAAGKHIFCEKPLALSLADADAALAAVGRAGVKLQIGFQRRFDPPFERAHARTGELGTLYLLRSTTRDPQPPPENYLRAAPSILTDTSIHDIDMLLWLARSPVVEVHAMGSSLVRPAFRERRIIDTCVTTLRFANGALGFIDNSWEAIYGYDVRAEVLGSGGAVEVGHAHETGLLRLDRAGTATDYPQTFLERFDLAYTREIQEFARCVLVDETPRVTGPEARADLAVALAAVQSLTEGRPVALK